MRILVLCLLLIGCSGGKSHSGEITESTNAFVVAGQSNAFLCDWSYLEYETENISISGRTINYLASDFDMSLRGEFDGIIFVHGETDSIIETPIEKYLIMVEAYRKLISSSVGKDLTLYISSVGSYRESYDEQFNALRTAVEVEALFNPSWEVFYLDAHTFRERNMLIDEIHFDQSGCEEMMDAFTSYIQ